MRIVAAAGHRKSLERMLDETLESTQARLDGHKPDLGLLFLTNHFEDEALTAAARVQQVTGVKNLLGCTAEGVIGPEHEYEDEPALALWLAELPGCTLRPFHFTQGQIEEASGPAHWQKLLNWRENLAPSTFMLGDPFSVDSNALLGGVNQHLPGTTVFGGMASGAEGPHQSALILNDRVEREGVVGVALAGQAAIDSVVSQGCRPIGKPFIITRAEGNVIYQLGGKKPLELLNRIFHAAPADEQELMKHGVFLGRVINEQQEAFERGDFLIRNLMGADENTGAIAVGDFVRPGTTVQFHVRDATTADEDLRSLLDPQASRPPSGALLFSCNGRGTRLYQDRDHDIGILRAKLGEVPVAGFFCAGEFGPVGGKNFIHGHTASIALFKNRR